MALVIDYDVQPFPLLRKSFIFFTTHFPCNFCLTFGLRLHFKPRKCKHAHFIFKSQYKDPVEEFWILDRLICHLAVVENVNHLFINVLVRVVMDPEPIKGMP